MQTLSVLIQSCRGVKISRRGVRQLCRGVRQLQDVNISETTGGHLLIFPEKYHTYQDRQGHSHIKLVDDVTPHVHQIA